MIINHYGHTVNSEIPVTGVLSINSLNWEYIDNEICLTCLEIISNIESDESLSDEQKQNELDYIECDPSHDKIIGDWKQDEHNKYYPDESKEYAAILREFTLQVVYSKHLATGALCSPCYPGQVDLDSTGDYLAYTLPEEMIYKGE